jgi:hypothetical protein
VSCSVCILLLFLFGLAVVWRAEVKKVLYLYLCFWRGAWSVARCASALLRFALRIVSLNPTLN